ncbi:MAG: lipoate--protein ligase family protein [Methanomassiliicoccales archaeon]|nr:MAG: lipoate--protein ligase family protein [Methanomassiliicoccales archaeon]
MLRERWRLLPFAIRDGALNMAIDEAIAEAISFNESPPTIRFYGWSPPAVTIGCFQSMRDEVDLDACHELGIDAIRRRTGGGAVFHDTDGEITYSVICPERYIGPDISASYHEVCSWIIDALGTFGLRAEFSPINDVVIDGRKISGNAQTRRSGVFTMHGTVLYKVDRERMFKVLKVGRTKVSDKNISSYGQRVVGASELVGTSLDGLLRALMASFLKGKQWYLGEMSMDEEARAGSLALSRYRSDDWNLSR